MDGTTVGRWEKGQYQDLRTIEKLLNVLAGHGTELTYAEEALRGVESGTGDFPLFEAKRSVLRTRRERFDADYSQGHFDKRLEGLLTIYNLCNQIGAAEEIFESGLSLTQHLRIDGRYSEAIKVCEDLMALAVSEHEVYYYCFAGIHKAATERAQDKGNPRRCRPTLEAVRTVLFGKNRGGHRWKVLRNAFYKESCDTDALAFQLHGVHLPNSHLGDLLGLRLTTEEIQGGDLGRTLRSVQTVWRIILMCHRSVQLDPDEFLQWIPKMRTVTGSLDINGLLLLASETAASKKGTGADNQSSRPQSKPGQSMGHR